MFDASRRPNILPPTYGAHRRAAENAEKPSEKPLRPPRLCGEPVTPEAEVVRTNSLEAALRERVLVADGAMGTMLYAAGLPAGTPPELWNRDNPAAVRAVHAAYVQAGADVILTNTVGGSRIALLRHGLAAQSPTLCRLAAEIAREVAGDSAHVFGSMGMLGELLQPLGLLSFEEALNVYAEQAAALAAGGADAILLETQSDVEEVRAGIRGAHQACTLPVIATFSFGHNRHTMMGAGAAEVAALLPEGLLAIGANCGRSLEDTLAVITELHALLPGVHLMAKPNAGIPSLGPDGKTHFDVGAEGMAAFMPRFLAQGARIVGGCCGSTPEHIRAISGQLSAISR